MLFLLCTWFPHRLESEDRASPRFCPRLMFFSVLGFPIGLSLRTMQVLGSVQNSLSSDSPFHQAFPEASSRGCPRPRLFLGVGHSPWALTQSGPGPRIHLAHELRDISATSGHAVLSDVLMIEVRLYEASLILWLQLTLEVEPEPFCL